MTDTDIISKYGDALKNRTSSVVDLSKKIDIDFDFQVHNINELVREFNGNMPPNKFNQHVLAIITNGSGKKQIGLELFDIAQDTIFYIPPYMIHSSRSWDLKTSGFMLTFNDSFFLNSGVTIRSELFNLFTNRDGNFFAECSSNKAANIVDLFKSIIEDSNSKEMYCNELIVLKVSQLLLYFHKEFHYPNQSYNSRYYRFLELLNKNYSKSRDVRFYADLLAIHPNYLNRVIKSKSGLTTKEVITNKIIIEAKYLLCTTPLSIKEISNKLGFPDQNSLSRLFKKIESISMSEYRERFV